MAKGVVLTNDLLTAGFSERIITLEVRSIHDIRSRQPAAAIARLAPYAGSSGRDVERFAVREGRGRELLIYVFERAARHLRTWRARGFKGPLYVQMRPEDFEDRTLATSFDVICGSQHLDASAFTIVIPHADYYARASEASNAIARIRKTGCGVAMFIDGNSVSSFSPILHTPFSALLLGGGDTWKRLRLIGPGKLGALGSWIGWAEALGLQRTALGIASANDAETAMLYGFGFGEGALYSEYRPARAFLEASGEAPPMQVEKEGLPPKPRVSLKRA